jgi:MarR family transcriptional regulator for hemolysin
MSDDDLLGVRAELFGSVFVLTQHLTRRTDAALETFGLTTRQWLLLAVLGKAFPDRSASLSEAAEKYGSSRQNVKQIAVGLESRGFLRLVPDPVDGRTTRLQVTDRVRVFDEPDSQARAAALLADAFAGLTPEETLALRDLVLRWLAGSTGTQDTTQAREHR